MESKTENLALQQYAIITVSDSKNLSSSSITNLYPNGHLWRGLVFYILFLILRNQVRIAPNTLT